MPLTTPLKKSHFFSKQTNKIFVSKTNKQNQVTTRKSDTHFNTQPTCFFSDARNNMELKRFFQHNIIKSKQAWIKSGTELWLWYFKKSKTEKEKNKTKQKQIDGELFFCVCACCVLTKFFFESSYSLLGFMLLN